MLISKMTRHVAFNANGAPEPIIDEFLLRAAIDFLRQTCAWITTETETLDSDEFPHVVFAPPSGRVFKILEVSIYGSPPLEQKTVSELSAIFEDWRTETGATPEYWTEEERGKLTVARLPDTGTEFEIISAHEPTSTASNIPDEIYEEFHDVIESGALSRLLLVPGKTWTNPELAGVHKQIFDAGVRRCKVRYHDRFIRGMNTAISPL